MMMMKMMSLGTVMMMMMMMMSLVLMCLFLWRRRRSSEEPPLDKGLIPWLGHALEFSRDAAGFLNHMKSKHGDIFTVCVAGRYVTVLLDPHSYDAVLQDPSLDFSRYAQLLMHRIFNLQLPQHDTTAERALMQQHFHGESLSCLTSLMHRNLKALLAYDGAQDEMDWKQDGLFNFCYRMLFRAGYLTLFSNGQCSTNDLNSIYEEFRRFDGLLTKTARTSLKSEEKRTVSSARQRLWDFLSVAQLHQQSPGSQWLQSYQKHLLHLGVDEETQRRALLLQLWATQGNAGPAAFWFLGFLLTKPETMSAVKKEFKSFSLSANRPEQLLMSKLQNTPVFDSTLSETLRLTAAPFITREVLHNTKLRLANGRQYSLREGDRVCLFPYVSPQMDPEVHQEPKKFKYDRFLNCNGTEKKDFFKGGQRLKYYNMPWGAGRNACVGRTFAISSIKLFIYLLLEHMDLEPCSSSPVMPDMDCSRCGFGMLQPVGDLRIRYKLKCPTKIFPSQDHEM